MKMSPWFLPLFAALAFAAGNVLHAQSAAAIQSWTASDGRIVRAKFVKLDGEAVVVEKDGKPITISLAKLNLQIDPRGPASGSIRVLRGGCWGCVDGFGVGHRGTRYDPGFSENTLGFRPARGIVP